MPFDPMELNPVIGVNTLVNGFGDANKSLVGLDMRVKLRDKLYVYGQFATDGPADERYAWQAGLRIFDLVRRDIHLQVEYNTATPFMYQNDPAQLAYVHAGLPLAHPMGAYFSEFVSILDIGFGRIIGRLAGTGRARLTAMLMSGTTAISAFVSTTGTVALMLPVTAALARTARISPSLLLMPMSVAAILGGLLTLIATPPNIIVSNQLRAAGFDARLVGVPASALYRVRVGRHDAEAGAEAELARLRAAGHDGAVVADARRELAVSR